MSDTEEVVITKASRGKKVDEKLAIALDEEAKRKASKTDIARQKLKEKRERLKAEKDLLLIEEAKKKLIQDEEQKAAQIAEEAKKAEEIKMKDPNYAMMKRLEEMMASLTKKDEPKVTEPKVPEPKVPEPIKKTRAPKVPEPKALKAPKAPKVTEVIDKPNKSKGLPARKNKVVYLPQDSPTNNFIGYDIPPPVEEPLYNSQQGGLLASLMSRRSMNSWISY